MLKYLFNTDVQNDEMLERKPIVKMNKKNNYFFLQKEVKRAKMNIESFNLLSNKKKHGSDLFQKALNETFSQSTYMIKQIDKIGTIDTKNSLFLQEMHTILHQLNNIYDDIYGGSK